ncbi:hypothetical protein Mal35_36450 [Gimesia maris]|nr:hypothetical protein Mal35_36450 [Gimesia maris]
MFNCEHPDAQIQAQALIIKEISPRNRLDFIFVTRSMKQGSLDSVSYHQEYRGSLKQESFICLLSLFILNRLIPGCGPTSPQSSSMIGQAYKAETPDPPESSSDS